MSYDYLFKLIFIGDTSVGKTAITAAHMACVPRQKTGSCPTVSEARQSMYFIMRLQARPVRTS